MPAIESFDQGTFCWVDLATPDAEAAKRFYAALFGWSMHDMPSGPDSTYTMLGRDGANVGGLYAMPDEMKQQGAPPHWACYIAVDDVDASAKKAAELGASIMAGPFDVMGVGRMAVVIDPTGAAVNLWQTLQPTGKLLFGEPGAMCWHELYTNDLDKSRRFYRELLGWTSQGSEGAANVEYHQFKLGDRPVAGMLEIQPEWGGMPPCWTVYFAVADIHAAIEKAESNGGATMYDPMLIPDVGHITMIRDPQGAHFSAIQLRTPCE